MLKISLTAARVNAGYTLDEVAKYMKKSKSTIISWEKGKTIINVLDFEQLCNLYKISKDNIFMPNILQKVEKERKSYD